MNLNMTDQNGKPLKESVLDAIKDGAVQMRPRWHFIVRSALIATGIVAAVLAIVFMASFIVYSLRVNGAWFAPSFGPRGLRTLLTSLPWVLVLVALLFMALLEIMVQRFAFAYRSPLLYSALAIIALAAVGGMAVARTSLHDGMYRFVEARRIPVAGPFYRQYGEPHLPDVHPGTVILMTEEGFRLEDRRKDVLRVRVSPETRFVPGPGVAQGDFVVVMGERNGDAVHAFGVRRFEARPEMGNQMFFFKEGRPIPR